MKKFLKVLAVCVLVITGVYFLKVNNVNVVDVTTNFVSDITADNNFVYTNDFKVNRLQIQEADYYYLLLTDKQKEIYSSIAKSVSKLDKTASVSGYEKDDETVAAKDVSYAMEAFFTDHPEVFYLNPKYTMVFSSKIVSYSLDINLEYSVANMAELETNLNTLDNLIKEYTANLDSKNDFEKELYLHDIIGRNSVYYKFDKMENIPDVYHTSYGALIEKEAVCDGFTKALQLVLDRVGIQSILVSGMLEEQAHAWNMVKIANSWYHVDLTSNKLIKETKDGESIVVHTYFNATDEMILKSHIIDTTYDIPKATDETYNYYKYYNYYIYGTDIFSDKLEDIVQKQSNLPTLEFAIDNIDDVPSKMSKTLYKINFNGYANSKVSTVNYYNVLNSYIVVK